MCSFLLILIVLKVTMDLSPITLSKKNPHKRNSKGAPIDIPFVHVGVIDQKPTTRTISPCTDFAHNLHFFHKLGKT